jgi:hypothetical protein
VLRALYAQRLAAEDAKVEESFPSRSGNRASDRLPGRTAVIRPRILLYNAAGRRNCTMIQPGITTLSGRARIASRSCERGISARADIGADRTCRHLKSCAEALSSLSHVRGLSSHRVKGTVRTTDLISSKPEKRYHPFVHVTGAAHDSFTPAPPCPFFRRISKRPVHRTSPSRRTLNFRPAEPPEGQRPTRILRAACDYFSLKTTRISPT